MGKRCGASYLTEEYIRVGDETRQKKGQPSLKKRSASQEPSPHSPPVGS